MPKLTERQRQCLQGFIDRKTAKETARELGITHHAVEKHLKAARIKLGASDTLEAARRYFGSADTTVGPYYGAPELSHSTAGQSFEGQPQPDIFRLRDSAADEGGLVQTLSAGQTLLAIGLCGVVMISILSLIVAVADGVAQLAP